MKMRIKTKILVEILESKLHHFRGKKRSKFHQSSASYRCVYLKLHYLSSLIAMTIMKNNIIVNNTLISLENRPIIQTNYLK